MLIAVRGLADTDAGFIRLDLETRSRLGVELGATYDVEFRTIGFLKKIRWACTASDPAARIAAWIAVWSLVLGVTSIVLVSLSFLPMLLGR